MIQENKQQPSSCQIVTMMCGVIIFWGINVIMIKYLSNYFPPLALAAIRTVIATSFLMPVCYRQYGYIALTRSSWKPVVGVALFSIFIHQIALSWGITATSANHAVLILGLTPLFTTLLASWLVKELLSRNKIGGAFLSLSGILLIITQSPGTAASTLAGDAVIFFAMLTYVLGSLCVKKSTEVMPPLAVTAYTHLLASLGLLILGFGINSEWIYAGALEPWPLTILFFSGWINTGLANIWWNTGVHHLGASTASLYLNGTPIVGMFASALFLGEDLAWQHYLASVLVLIGVMTGTGAFTRLKSSKEPEQS